MGFDLFTIVGVIGSSLIIVTYFAAQQGWLRVEDWRYSLLNLLGALLILLSLITAWNLAAAVIETFWAAISIYGLIRHALHRLDR